MLNEPPPATWLGIVTLDEIYGRPGLCRAQVVDRGHMRYCRKRAIDGSLFCEIHGGRWASARTVVRD